jgi:hypothetical protein
MRAWLTATTIIFALCVTAGVGFVASAGAGTSMGARVARGGKARARRTHHRRSMGKHTHCVAKPDHGRGIQARRRRTAKHHSPVKKCTALPHRLAKTHALHAPPGAPAPTDAIGPPAVSVSAAASVGSASAPTTPTEAGPPTETGPPTKSPAPPEEPTPPEEPPPVKAKGPLLGSPKLQTSTDTDPAGSAEAFEYTALASGTVNSLALYVASGSTARSIVVGLYTNAAGHPGTLLTSATISSPVAGAWNTVSVQPVAVSAGSIYWLAALASGGKLTLLDIEGGGPTQESKSNSLGTLPSSWSSGATYANSPASFYASAAVVGPPPPPPTPTASFTYSPASPVVGEPVTFNGASSTCPEGPCTYEWSNDGGPSQPIPPQFPLGSGQTITLTFSSAGTEYMRLLVTDVLGATATIEHNVTVAPEPPPPPPPPPPTAPSNTAAPSVSGTAQVGQTLTAHNGTWSGTAPISYTYQWQRDGTTDIVGATGPTYKPVAADVEHTLDVLVTATNSAGSESAASAKTAAVIKESSSGQQTDCIDDPSACGYPDATNTGVPAGTTLTSQANEINVTTPGTTIKDLALDGSIAVEANNTTIENSEITVNGTQGRCSGSCGGRGIWIKPGVTGTVIQNVTCHGGAASGENVTQYCIMSNDSATTIKHLHAYYCTECLAGPMDVSESFIDETGATIPGEHYEDIYYGGGAGPLIVNHNTMLNPNGQTAVVFASVDFGNQTTLTITNNLMAGGGYTIYGGGSGSGGTVVGPVTITGNRFSRKYYPESGSYGIASYLNNSVTTWSGNVWDETLQTVPMPGG